MAILEIKLNERVYIYMVNIKCLRPVATALALDLIIYTRFTILSD